MHIYIHFTPCEHEKACLWHIYFCILMIAIIFPYILYTQYFLTNIVDVEFARTKMYLYLMYILMRFGKFMHLCDRLHYHDTEHFHHPFRSCDVCH